MLGLSFTSKCTVELAAEENLRMSARPRRSNVTLDEHSVKFKRIADLRKQRGSYALHLTRKGDELKSLLDSGASVDRVQKGIAQVRAALRNLSDCNAKFIQLLEGADMPAENNSSEVLRLAEHRVSVLCA